MTRRAWIHSGCIALGIVLTAGPLRADSIYATNDPFGGFFGITGFDVFEDQSVAVRFTPGRDYQMTGFTVWLWNNDENGREPAITLSLRNDISEGDISIPGEEISESWTMNVPNTGLFQPVLFSFNSVLNPTLLEGVNYWIVAESDALALADPVWAWAANDSGFCTTTAFDTGEWQPGGEGAVATLTVDGDPIGEIAGDIDGDGHVTLADLATLLAVFGACDGDASYNPAADFDQSGCIDLADLAVLLSNFGL